MIVDIFLLVMVLSVQTYGEALEVDIEVLEPRGVIISIPDDIGIEGFFFLANINEEFTSTNKSKIKLSTEFPDNDKWVVHDNDLVLKEGDVINYVFIIKRYGVIVRYGQRNFTVGLKQSIDEPNKLLPMQTINANMELDRNATTQYSNAVNKTIMVSKEINIIDTDASNIEVQTVPGDGLGNANTELLLRIPITVQIPTNSNSTITLFLYTNATALYSYAVNRINTSSSTDTFSTPNSPNSNLGTFFTTSPGQHQRTGDDEYRKLQNGTTPVPRYGYGMRDYWNHRNGSSTRGNWRQGRRLYDNAGRFHHHHYHHHHRHHQQNSSIESGGF